jgi:hypothetical protein
MPMAQTSSLLAWIMRNLDAVASVQFLLSLATRNGILVIEEIARSWRQ